VVRRIFEPKGEEVAGEDCIMRSFVTCTLHQVILGSSNQGGSDMITIFWLEKLKGRDHSEDLGVDGRIILEWILGKYNGRVWTRVFWLRTGTSGGFSEHGNETLGC
jgi:hypothetical protein